MRKGLTLLVLLGALLLPVVAWADGVCPCPENTVLVAKFEYNENTGTYIQTEGEEGIITIGDDANANGGSWNSTAEVRAMVVKGGTSCSTEWFDPLATSGTFSNGGLEPTPGGDQPAVSFVEFCRLKPTKVGLSSFTANSPTKLPWLVELLRRLWLW